VPLEQAVASGLLRGDLYARLDGVVVRVPPLRERREDIVPLFYQFLKAEAARMALSIPPVDARLLESLCLYDWPFNVRELLLLASRLVIMRGESAILRRSHLPERMQPERVRQRISTQPKARETSQVAEDPLEVLIAALKRNNGNLTSATKELGWQRRAKAYDLLRKHDLDPASFRNVSPEDER
jgi:two-component system C4-dicarboxylate transport response regulator DctD